MVGAVPAPGCFVLGGMAYVSDGTTLLLSDSEGVAEARDAVLVSAHTTTVLDT